MLSVELISAELIQRIRYNVILHTKRAEWKKIVHAKPNMYSKTVVLEYMKLTEVSDSSLLLRRKGEDSVIFFCLYLAHNRKELQICITSIGSHTIY